MTNVLGTPQKAHRAKTLFRIGVETLRRDGWNVERISGIGKSSVRRITKGQIVRTVSIRTSQDTWIAFPRNKNDKKWVTLSDVDVVLAVSVDDRENAKFAQVHMLEADEVRERFDRAYAARRAAGYKLPLGRGVWVSLYDPEANDPVTHVGAGAGIQHPPIARVPLEPRPQASAGAAPIDGPLTIADAKRRLAASLGVDPASIRITVEA